MRRHVILVGLAGAGKSTVGRLVAERLGAPFADSDQRVPERAGRSIADVFAQEGEPAFRSIERAVMEELLAEPPQVIAAGGGWAAQPGALEGAGARALTVYLVCSAETAAVRATDTTDRPLLRGDRVAALRELLARRSSYYERAEARVDTERRTPELVASEVVALARSVGGW